ncbi:NAD(P)-dependent oxidoreductase [Streptomyces sp. AJS327]|uniref:NAD(P)-dependent oxidoreductase n=1 Tax=Streptomyces sp. AJS327 TaxID=2545265 RepID=UPI0015DF9217|nr:NAD(P)-dependent oxidoreductase [Streptomyces sp. AJS327]MBA0050916.1 NAD(P)-dependent oxidoreductase [Streptomyces sp. AJS327]
MQVGFIGLGRMGTGMARNTATSHPVTVHDARPEAVRELTVAGATAASSARGAADGADVLVTMLPGPEAIEAVMLGDGVARALRPGALWIDMSSSSLDTMERVKSACPDRGWTALDAPVTGGVPGAEEGSLQVFVGGTAADYERSLGVLTTMGDPERILHVGGQGCGYTVKLCVNLGFFLHAVAGAEVMALGTKAGVDIDLLHDALTRSGASSKFIENDLARNVFAGDYKEYFRLALALKDIRLAVDLGRSVGVPLEVAALVEQLHHRALLTQGDGGQLLAVKQLEEAAGIALRRQPT